MNIKAISRNVGAALLVSALFMFLSVLVSVARGNDSALAALIISFTITFTVGVFPFIFVRKTYAITMTDGYMIIVFSWLLSFIFGMLPYALWGGPFTVINAWFESVSGFTTTGSTILDNIEALPDSLLFWRSSTHFIGGLGVVVFLLLIIPNASPIRLRLTNMELSSLSRDSYKSRTNKTVFIFAYVYLGLVVAAFFCYLLVGMRPFDAINHAMSVCATGGFSTRNRSIASYESLPVILVTMVFMLLASIHFGMIFMAFIRHSFKPFKNEVFRFYIKFLAVSILIVTLALKFEGISRSWGDAVLVSSFHVLSYASTTGFAIADNATWPYIADVILMIMGIVCGMAGSTTGGIKSDRALILYKEIGYHIKKVLHPASITEVRVNGHVVKQEEVAVQVLYVALYFLVMLLSMVVCLLVGTGNKNAFIGTLSTLGNVGPAVGGLGTFGNYGAEPATSKFMYTINMFLGRVEIYPILAVILMTFSKRRK